MSDKIKCKKRWCISNYPVSDSICNDCLIKTISKLEYENLIELFCVINDMLHIPDSIKDKVDDMIIGKGGVEKVEEVKEKWFNNINYMLLRYGGRKE